MTDRLGEYTRSYWPVVLALLAAAVAWGTVANQVSTLNENQNKLNVSQTAISAKLDRIAEGQAASLATNIANERDIADLRTRIHGLEVRAR